MSQKIIDVNVNLFRWPFRRVAGDDTHHLVEKFRERHVTQAWAGSFEGLFHRDMEGVNARLVAECKERGHGILIPFGSINPMLPDWEEDLRRCHEVHKMRGIRLHPNYHGYKLSDPVFRQILQMAVERKLIVQLAVLMEDRRTQSPMFQIPPVEIAPLWGMVEKMAGLRLVLLNSFQGTKRDLLVKLAATKRVFFEPATLEGVGGIENLLPQIPASQLLFGSHSPLFYFESALLKLRESELTEAQMKMICEENASNLLK